MKTFSKIKLNKFSKDELDRRKLKALKGGCSCTSSCSCRDYMEHAGFYRYYQAEGYCY